MSYTEMNYSKYYDDDSEQLHFTKVISEYGKRRSILKFDELDTFNYFADVSEFLTVATTIDKKMVLSNAKEKLGSSSLSSENPYEGADWSGAKSFEEAIDRLDRPEKFYKNEIQEINNKTEQLMPKVLERMDVPSVQIDITGQFIDIGIYNTGNPECFFDIQPTSGLGLKDITLRIGPLHSNASVSSDNIKEYSLRVTLLYNTLLAMGYSPAVEYIKASDISATYIILTNGKYRMSTSILYALLYPATFRRLIFRLIERSPLLESGYGYGLTDIDVPYLYLDKVIAHKTPQDFVSAYLKENNLVASEDKE